MTHRETTKAATKDFSGSEQVCKPLNSKTQSGAGRGGTVSPSMPQLRSGVTAGQTQLQLPAVEAVTSATGKKMGV